MKLRQSAGKFLARFLRADEGLSAVEFALLLPVMLIFYLGGVQVSMAVSTYRLVNLTANTVTNLVAQYTTISKTAMRFLAMGTNASWPDGEQDDGHSVELRRAVMLRQRTKC